VFRGTKGLSQLGQKIGRNESSAIMDANADSIGFSPWFYGTGHPLTGRDRAISHHPAKFPLMSARAVPG
jgi:hypothetical protein